MDRQYCASSYVIDFEHRKVLLVYNQKLKKWLQPGGHIEKKEELNRYEYPWETAVRETLEETGIHTEIIGNTFDSKSYQPIAVEHYLNKIGDMIDIQYLAIPISLEISSQENLKCMWYDIDDLDSYDNIDDEIKIKVKTCFNKFK